MAERRMFAKTIVLSDDFLDMPMTARCLYFTLGMLADDDGFINSPKSIMRQCGATADDMRILLGKRFLLQFETGVIVIKHWRINNYLRSDRYTETLYQEEKGKLEVDAKGNYHLSDCSGIPMVHQADTNGIPTVSTGKDSIGKGSLVEDSLAKGSVGNKKRRFTPPDVEEVDAYIKEKGYHFDAEEFVAYYASQKWKKANGLPLSDWKKACVTWEKKRDEKTENRVAQDIHRTYDMLNEWANGE